MVWRLLPENMVCLFPFPEVFVNVLPQGLSFSLHTDACSLRIIVQRAASLSEEPRGIPLWMSCSLFPQAPPDGL